MKRSYYFKDPIKFLTWYFEQLPASKRPAVANKDNFAELAKGWYAQNKEEVDKAMLNENKKRKESKVKAFQSVKPENRQEQLNAWSNGSKQWRLDNTDKVIENAGKGGKAGGSKGGTNRMASMTKEERSSLSRYANSCMSKEKRAETGKTKSKNDAKKRNEYLKSIYDTIEETSWFTHVEVLYKYKFKGRNKNTKNKILTEQMMKVILRDKNFFESKVERFNYINEAGKLVNSQRVLFKKI